MTRVTFTSWARLEPITSDPSLAPGVSAEVADPLWLLGRQWQLGEYAGEDSGTPAWVEVYGETATIGRVALGPEGTAWQAYDRTRPLEVLVEAEPLPGYASGAHLAARAGLRFIRELVDRGVAAATRAAVTSAYSLAIPGDEDLSPDVAGFLGVAARSAPDGLALGRALRGTMGTGPTRGDQLPAELAGVSSTQAFVDGCHAFLDWLETIADLRRAKPALQPPGWRPERLDQTFAVAAATRGGAPTVLRAPEYRGGTLDWWAFELSTEQPPATALPPTTSIRADVLATPLGFPGAPVERYWEIEDAAVDLSAATVAPHETASLLLLEYVFAFGGDALLVPLELAVGSRAHVGGVVIVDVFGDRVLSEPSGVADVAATRARFAMFGCSGDEDALLLAPAICSSLDSEPIEDVVLLRDETANLGWAVEAFAPDASGASVDWRTLLPAPDPTTPPPLPPAIADDRPPLQWRLMRPPPAHWYPLVPVARGDRLTSFAVGTMELAAGASTAPPRSVALAELAAAGLREEELAREGRRLVRTISTARWIDGGLHAWTARRTLPGRGEGSSSVRFDAILPDDPLGR